MNWRNHTEYGPEWLPRSHSRENENPPEGWQDFV